jgi:hypothetical protein
MAAKKKSASRKPAAKKAAKKKAAKRTPTKRAPARKKAVASRKVVAPPPTPVRSAALVEIDNRIAIVRNNLRALVEQAASYSGASNEELVSQRISDQEAKLAALLKQRDEVSQRGS